MFVVVQQTKNHWAPRPLSQCAGMHSCHATVQHNLPTLDQPSPWWLKIMVLGISKQERFRQRHAQGPGIWLDDGLESPCTGAPDPDLMSRWRISCKELERLMVKVNLNFCYEFLDVNETQIQLISWVRKSVRRFSFVSGDQGFLLATLRKAFKLFVKVEKQLSVLHWQTTIRWKYHSVCWSSHRQRFRPHDLLRVWFSRDFMSWVACWWM